MNIGGSPLPWASGKILGLIITGGVLLIIFVFWGKFKQRGCSFGTTDFR